LHAVAAVLVAVLVGLAISQVAIFLTTVYLHRTVSHRALTLKPPADLGCRALLWITTGLKPREWAAVHRKHHAFTDVEGDPHSPLLLGFWRVQLTNAALYRKVARDPRQVARYARDLPPDRWDRWLFDHALIGLAIGVGGLVLLLGWELALLAAAVHVVTYLALNASINAVGHTWGSRPYGNTGTNNQWLAYLTAGEGLHNNHHASPTSARLALGESEVDPGWWLVRALAGVRLARVRHDRAPVRGIRAEAQEPAA
jgi:stearoyl-CoA desaturase (Delta-9 desaturase)